MNLNDYILMCPRCGSIEVKKEKLVKDDMCRCLRCGCFGQELEFVFWPVKYGGENHYLICN